MKSKSRVSPFRSESGVALVMVLGVLAACLLLIVHIMTVSEVVGREAVVAVQKSRLRYQAESASDFTFWMHLNDRRLFTDRTLGQSADDELRSNYDFEPWMMDRRPHDFDDGLVVTYLGSALDGFDYQNPDSLKDGLSSDDTDYADLVEEFMDILEDYTDSDDLRKLHGMEYEDYAAEGYPTMPRNGKPTFRAELYWLPGWQDAIIGEIAYVPPRGITLTSQNSGRGGRNSASSGKPSFFTSSSSLIAQKLDVEDAELEEVLAARAAWMDDGTALSDTLDTELYSKVQNAFSFKESAVATLTAAAYDDNKEIRTIFKDVRIADISNANFFADSKREALSIWERTVE